MIEVKTLSSPKEQIFPSNLSFTQVQKKLQKWLARFPRHEDPFLNRTMLLFYLLAGEKYLDHRSADSLFRLILAIYFMQKRLIEASTLSETRLLEIKWISSRLIFPFSSKYVPGCLIGFNLVDRYEVFDEENVHLILQKYLPHLRLVKESCYSHISAKDLKCFYFEIEKTDGSQLNSQDRVMLKHFLEQKLKQSIQRLSPLIFMRRNEEEIYKNILVLSEQIQSKEDLPQASIFLDRQSQDEIVFLINLVCVSPGANFLTNSHFDGGFFVLEHNVTVKYLQTRPVQAYILRTHLDRETNFLRSDGSLDFYRARRKAVQMLVEAIGEFRDYNGGILIKQQELLQNLKEAFPSVVASDSEIIEAFFYAILPLEKQMLFQFKLLSILFARFLKYKDLQFKEDYVLDTSGEGQVTFFILCINNSSLKESLSNYLKTDPFSPYDVGYNIIECEEKTYFQGVLFEQQPEKANTFLENLHNLVLSWEKNNKKKQVLRIGFQYSLFSLDPRIGGEALSQVILGLLFEGLTRFDGDGKVHNGTAENILISEDYREYTFQLRPCFWNDGSPLTAYDFEYAWKKVLSPDFKTAFAYLFYPIKGAKEAKEGKISLDKIGIWAIDERTLKVRLENPTPYFLELTSLQIYAPVHRLIDQQDPQWSYQVGNSYPCNGAFVLKINKPGQCYKLEKNPRYWDVASISLDQLIFNRMTPYQAFEAFKKREIDWLGHPLGSWDSLYEAGKEDRVISFPNGSVCWCVFNTSEGPFRSKKLRQAIAFAIQRSDLIRQASLPITPAFTPLLPQHSHSTKQGFMENIQLARELWIQGWEELGVQESQIPPLTLLFHHKGTREHVAYHLQQQFNKALGAQIVLKPLSWDLLFEAMSKGNFTLGLMQWSSWVDDPIYTLNSFRSAQEGTNFAKWEHPRYQELMQLCDQEPNLAQRKAYFAAAEELLCREMPVVPLFYQPFQALVKSNLNVSYNISRATFNLARCFYKKLEVFYDSPNP
jgi:oligopeptide transport system substrate-binding protein